MTNSDKNVVRKLPYTIGDGRPDDHFSQSIMLDILNPADRRETVIDGSRIRQMHQAMQDHGRHNVNEQRRDFIQRVEDQRVPPHGNRPGVIPVGKAVGRYHETAGVWEDPDREQEEDIDKVAEIGEEVVVATLVVGVVADWHEVEQLERVPNVDPFSALQYRVSSAMVALCTDMEKLTDIRRSKSR